MSRGRREVVLVVVDPLSEVLSVSTAVDDLQVFEGRDVPVVL